MGRTCIHPRYRGAKSPLHPCRYPSSERSRTTTLSIVHLVLGVAPGSQVKAEGMMDLCASNANLESRKIGKYRIKVSRCNFCIIEWEELCSLVVDSFAKWNKM